MSVFNRTKTVLHYYQLIFKIRIPKMLGHMTALHRLHSFHLRFTHFCEQKLYCFQIPTVPGEFIDFIELHNRIQLNKSWIDMHFFLTLSCYTTFINIWQIVSMFSNKNELHCQLKRCLLLLLLMDDDGDGDGVNSFFCSRTKSFHSVIGSQISTTITFISVGNNYFPLHISESIFLHGNNHQLLLPSHSSIRVKWTSKWTSFVCMCVAHHLIIYTVQCTEFSEMMKNGVISNHWLRKNV